MIDAVAAQIVSAIIIAIGNFLGLYFGLRRLERRVDKKLGVYVKEFRGSQEGTLALTVLKDLQKLLSSKDAKELMEGMQQGVKELTDFLKDLRAKANAPDTTGEEEEMLLPTLNRKE